jgi:hypothetical protein
MSFKMEAFDSAWLIPSKLNANNVVVRNLFIPLSSPSGAFRRWSIRIEYYTIR